MKKTILFAALLLAAVAPLWGQDFKQANDSTWIRWGVNTMGLYEEVASPVDYNLIVADINNDLRRCAHLKAGALGCGAVSGLSAFWALQRSKHGKPIVLQEVICGLSAVGCLVLEISEIVTLNRDKAKWLLFIPFHKAKK